MKEIEKMVWESLKGVIDPELKTNVVDAGLIKKVEERNGVAYIDMVLTTPFCPIADLLALAVKKAAERVKGIKEAKVKIVGYGMG